MSEHERRRHPRYVLHLPVTLHCGGRQLSADVVNASAGGCLLQLSEPLAPGELFEASIPMLQIPTTRMIVVRCHAAQSGYMVAAHFESLLAEDSLIRKLSDDQQSSKPPQLH